MMLVLTVLLVSSFLIYSAPLAPLASHPSGAKPAVSRQSSAEVTKIQNYHDQIDRWAKSHPNAVRYFSTVVQDDNSSPWKAFPNKASLPPLETHASVWIKDGQVVATIISFKSDHTESTDGSYFRADGTLAYREIHQYSIGLDPPFSGGKSYYDASGTVLRSNCWSSVDDQTRKPCSTEETKNFTDGNADTLFLTNAKFPFSDVMGSAH
jgi:hypothetical protein